MEAGAVEGGLAGAGRRAIGHGVGEAAGQTQVLASGNEVAHSRFPTANN